MFTLFSFNISERFVVKYKKMIFNLHSLLENIFLFVNYTYGFYIWAIFSSILQISLILLYLIEFKFLYARLII